MSEHILPVGERTGISRRQFLKASAGAAALFGVSSLTSGHLLGFQLASAAQVQLNSDLDILNFALTLELLEDMAYQKANSSGVLSGRVADIFKAFGDHEHTHAVVLADTIRKLGGTPVQLPSNLTFPEFTSQQQAALFFAEVETIGTGGYLGAAPSIQDKALLAAAASIVTVEAQHASVLYDIANVQDSVPAFDVSRTADEVVAMMSLTKMNIGKLPPPAGTANTQGAVGMPRTGTPGDGLPTALAVAAGLFAAATGALLHIRTRNTKANEADTTSNSSEL
ncbi:MAG: ferritin-like domain-containing protein [Chloroflexia bacterium]